MNGLKVYQVCSDNGQACSKQLVVAYDEREAKDRVHGRGEVMAVKEMKDYKLDTAQISNVLLHGNISRNDVDIIMDILAYSGIGW